ncbi:MotA/TolQ/ExbB proton channel family protein [Nitrosococcus wardiae]|uniref:MotA/TolQ/ExbB proton channel family protein n=1 Tax=Nitrosococcus wardiae TaxID=1814290 RepID=A0A4P7BV91_9GAMM|nr:MotA/TolQ/ExbB proton channel family protein [Nitrosococcus wardiae]QBQ53918.1 MotA/TolQ/ExbB proton channel family protein [Nitrosococcus wardiae]
MNFSEIWEAGSHFYQAGGYVMPPLMVATLLLWFAIGYRFWILRRGTVLSVRECLCRLQEEPHHQPQGMIEHMIVQGLAIARTRPPYLRRHLDEVFAAQEQELKKFATLIRSIVVIAPLLGLLGTVVGMIETFESLADMALFTQSGGIAGGISQALFTTQMGLVVAIPGLLIKGLLDRKQKQLEMEFAQIKDLLCSDTFSSATQAASNF